MSKEERILAGGCHCGDHTYTLVWPSMEGPLPARRCGCGFCTRFGATWTSHPEARLTFQTRPDGRLHRYRFGSGTADFLSCSRCGVIFAAVDGQGAARVGIINVNTLDQGPASNGGEHQWDFSDSDFDGEAVSDRRARRQRNWCRQVSGLDV